MGRQLDQINSNRRKESSPDIQPKEKVRLFKIILDAQGFDDSGHHWGKSRFSIYCAHDKGDYRRYVKAKSRKGALRQLKLSKDQLIIGNYLHS